MHEHALTESPALLESGFRTFYLRTFGCQMNEHDSERIHGMLATAGLLRVEDPNGADLLLFNTCSIREKADTRLAGHLGEAARLKRQGRARLVIVAGCLAQSRREDFFAEFPVVDVLMGPQSLHELPRLLEERLRSGGKTGAFREETELWSADLPRVRQEGPRAWLQIVSGCSNYCSYCIVPYVRGREASRPAAAIVEEAETLVAQGVREITLLGQNVNAYGKEPGFAGAEDFPALLESLAGVRGLDRIRFMTSHPKDVSPALISTMSELPQVCEHLHLPLQSGSDRVLAAMRRKYDTRVYLDLVQELRDSVPGLALTTDLIVGFPGETEEDFEATLSVVEACRFDAAFTFVYSPRPHTAAARLPGRVAPEVAEGRMRRLVALTQRLAAQSNQALVGEVVEVLVEGRSRQDPAAAMGRTRANRTVNLDGPARPGDLVNVLLESATSTSFRGRLQSACPVG